MDTKQQLQLVTPEQAKFLKDLEFDWKTTALHYVDAGFGDGFKLENHNADDGYTSIPTVAQALMWCRNERGIQYNIGKFYGKNYSAHIIGMNNSVSGKTYEEVESKLLDECINAILETQKK